MAKRVLFLCTHNSARSQMAEGLLRAMGQGRFEAFSAGTEATLVRPLAIQVMAEVGVDLSDQYSKTYEQFFDQPFDYIITVCDQARENCPHFPKVVHRIHWWLPDPSIAIGTQAEQLEIYRQVRESLRLRLKSWLRSQNITFEIELPNEEQGER